LQAKYDALHAKLAANEVLIESVIRLLALFKPREHSVETGKYCAKGTVYEEEDAVVQRRCDAATAVGW
jgi:hypothetical protein